jgi:hypothetical protein
MAPVNPLIVAFRLSLTLGCLSRPTVRSDQFHSHARSPEGTRRYRHPERSPSAPSADALELLVESPIFLVNFLSQTTFIAVIVALNVVACRLPMTDRGLVITGLVLGGALSIRGVPNNDRGRQQNYSNKNPAHSCLLWPPCAARPRARRARSAGGSLLYWMPVLGILRMARGLSNPIGFSSRGRQAMIRK